MVLIANIPTVGLFFGCFFFFVGLALVGLGVFGFWSDWSSGYSSDFWLILGIIASGVVVLLITLAAMWPLKYDYHYYVSKSGTVEQVSNRFISDGNHGVSQRFVIKMIGDPLPYSIDDTRASLLKPGVHIGIKCKKEHQFFQSYSQDGYACRWGT